jgi:hypothetical protein
MSTAVATAAVPRGGSGRPRYGTLFGSAAFAQIVGWLCLFVVSVLVSLSGIVGLSSGRLSVYAPWVIDGPWSLLASIGWGVLVSAVIAAILRERVVACTAVPVSRGLTVVSVAIGGYAPWLLTASGPGRTVLSLLLVPAVLQLVAFEHSGGARALPRAVDLSGRHLVATLAISVLVLVLPYALLHPLAIRGSGQSGGNFTTNDSGFLYSVRPGQLVHAQSGIETGVLPITVTGVRPLASASDVRIVKVAIAGNVPLSELPVASGGLALAVPARHLLWVGFAVRLTDCRSQAAGVTRIRISYRELGLSLSQTVPLAGSDTLLTCTQP